MDRLNDSRVIDQFQQLICKWKKITKRIETNENVTIYRHFNDVDERTEQKKISRNLFLFGRRRA